ncbi:DUF6497 family protein [Pseudothioclava arenosa]|uniref:DUF6497 family protein n=1 Tax=Pseudothioclava arenosa TaxID=1795308 RepID=UPI001FE4A52F|nr:DUF6497 family protein [Pseudothioclava arenosa]
MRVAPGQAGIGLASALLALSGLAWPGGAQELREVPQMPDYSAFFADLGERGDGPEGTFGDAIEVPSGQKLWWIDVQHTAPGSEGLTYRFRFLAPQIGGQGALSVDVALLDIEALCGSFVAPRLANLGPQVEQVVISLSDRIVPFGEAAPEAVQYFEAFSVEDGACTWELF